jgi:tetratricopeptide (TPR) repeat protein
MASPDRSSTWTEAAILSVALLLLYGVGACPTIYVGDSGELVTAAYTLGVPHPTGYPLYVLLGKLWTLLVPAGSIAYRMSLFSAACAALACGLLYRCGRQQGLDRIAALLAALLLAFSPSFWGEANVQRVYALNAVFVVLATSAALAWQRDKNDRDLVRAFFWCALGATNHTFMGIYAAVLGLYALVTTPTRLLRVGMIARIALAMVVGLLPYAYLPIRSRMNPRLDWGNPETLQGFLGVVLRRDFWQRAWLERPFDLLVIAADYLHSLGVELAWVGTALAVVGLFISPASRGRTQEGAVLRRWRPALLLLVMAANVTALALHGSRSDIFIWHRYYIPSYVMAALLAGMGCHWLVPRLPRPLRLAPLLIPAFLFVSGWAAFDRSRYRIAEDFSLQVLRTLPPGAHLIATDDNILFVLMYLHLVEQRRPDIDLILQGVGDADLPPLRFNPDSDPVFFTHHPNWNIAGLDIVPAGLLLRAWRADRPPPPFSIERAELDGESDPRVPKDYLTENLIGHFHYMIGFAFESTDWPRARAAYARATRASPDNDVLFYNLGLIYARNGLFEDAIAAFERSRAINPRHIASEKKPRAGDRLRELRVEHARLGTIERELAANAALTMDASDPAYHQRMAELLERRGERVAAHGHRLRAREIETGLTQSP